MALPTRRYAIRRPRRTATKSGRANAREHGNLGPSLPADGGGMVLAEAGLHHRRWKCVGRILLVLKSVWGRGHRGTELGAYDVFCGHRRFGHIGEDVVEDGGKRKVIAGSGGRMVVVEDLGG